MKSPKLYRSGFTLVELIVAFVILVVGVVAILELSGQSVLNISYARDKTTATMLAQQKLEEFLVRPSLSVGETEGNFGDSYTKFRWKARVKELVTETQPTTPSGQELPPIFHISVIVEWTDRGINRSIMLEAIKAQGLEIYPFDRPAKGER